MQYSIPRRIWRIIYPPLIYIAISLIVGLLVSVAIIIYAGVREAASGAVLNQARLVDELSRMVRDNSQAILLISGIAGLAAFLPLWMRTRRYIAAYKNSAVLVTALLTAGVFAGFNLLLVCVIDMTDILRFFPSYEGVSEQLTSGAFVFQILALGIAVPIVEELCFRGILINRMKWLPVPAAVFIQAALFGLVHMNLFQGLYAFVLGILLALLYLRFRSVTLTIIGHMSFNLASIILTASAAGVRAVVILIPAATIMAVCAILLCSRPAAELIEGDALIL